MKIENKKDLKQKMARVYLAVLFWFMLDMILALSTGRIREYSVALKVYAFLYKVWGDFHHWLSLNVGFFDSAFLLILKIFPWLILALVIRILAKGSSLFRLEKANGYLEIEGASFMAELIGIPWGRKRISVAVDRIVRMEVRPGLLRKRLRLVYEENAPRQRTSHFSISYLSKKDLTRLKELSRSLGALSSTEKADIGWEEKLFIGQSSANASKGVVKSA